MKIELVRKENKVYYNDAEVRINPQATKNYPVVDLLKLGLDDWQRYVALNSLKEGLNIVELKPRKQTDSAIVLTQEEKAQIAELEARIKEIKENARKRTPVKKAINLKDISKLSQDEVKTAIAELEAYLAKRKGE